MSTIKLAQANVGTLTVWLRARVAQFSAVTYVMRHESRPRSVSSAPLHAHEVARAERLFAQAVQEDSNLELDWLWCAANMTSLAEQRYCLLRALEINPDSELAKRALAKLPPDVAAAAVALAGRLGA